jgi:hypothetical protein
MSPKTPSTASGEALALLTELLFLLRQRPLWNSVVQLEPDLLRIVQRAASLVQDQERLAAGEQP